MKDIIIKVLDIVGSVAPATICFYYGHHKLGVALAIIGFVLSLCTPISIVHNTTITSDKNGETNAKL